MLPGGHNEPEKGENLESTAKRENFEETTLANIAGYHFLFYLENSYQNNNRVFFVYEGFYVDKTKRINLPKTLLKEESIKRAKWFALKEIENIPLSAIATRVIKKALLPSIRQTSFFHRSANRLQAILLDAQKNIKDKEYLLQVSDKIKMFTIFLNESQDSNQRNILQSRHRKKELVIIVEDDRSVAEITRDILERNFRVIIFDNPTTTLQWLKMNKQKIKAMLVDYHFSADEKTGIGFIEEVDASYANIKTILFTGFGKIHNYSGRMLRKPATVEELKEAIIF